RWGELLFRSEGYNVPFDGKYNNKDLPVGTYYHIINLNHPAYPKPYTGPLTIFR
ncbi:MAG: T9SS type B sorting domain-containing protein, partial [Bacteroidia bacterium]